MKKVINMMIITVMILITAVMGASCLSKDNTDYEHLRDVSWEGTELTIKLGENKSTGCEWDTHPEDDSVIDYSANRVFHLADSQVVQGNAIGTLEAGFKGKGAGTSCIICTTPVGWDGTGDGLAYIVTVTVNEDGTIESAEGVESEPIVSDETIESGAEATLEEYFKNHPDEFEEIKKNINSDESINGVVDIDMTAEGNTLSYIYTFREILSDEKIEQITPELKKSLEGEVSEDMKNRIPAIEQGFGVKGISIYMEYRNGDGTKITGITIE